MKWVGKILLVLFVFVVILVVGAGIWLATFDINNYKDRVEAAVRENTGRDLEIAGNIEASFYPVLGFAAHDVRLGNPPDFPKENFLSVDRVQAGVKLRPLRSGRIELTKIILNKPVITIVKKAGGETNLAFDRSAQTGQDRQDGQADQTMREFSVEAIEISDARVMYTDQGTGQAFVIAPLNMTLSGFTPGQETAAKVDMIIKTGGREGEGATVDISANALTRVVPDSGVIELQNLETDMTLRAAALAGPVNARMSGGGSVNTRTSELNLSMPSIDIGWQDTDIEGQAQMAGPFQKPAIEFSARAQAINLDTLTTKAEKTESESGNQDGQNDAAPLLPVNLLRTLTLAGLIDMGTLTANDITIRNVHAEIDARNGQIELAPVTADFYQGRAETRIAVDARGQAPVISLQSDVSGLDIGMLLQDRLGDEYVTGTANARFDLQASGNSVQALRRSAGGTARFDFEDGYIQKWQISRLLNQAIAFFEQGAIPQDTTDQIQFTALTASLNGQNGIFRNEDLVITGPRSHALGSGLVDFAGGTIDYTLLVGLGETPEQGERRLPISITGPLSSPQYSLDTKTLVIDTIRDRLLDEVLPEEEDGGAAEEGAGGDSDSGDADFSSPEEAARELLQGILGGQ